MNILVTNDDGIESPGIWALAKSLSLIGTVLLVAPDKQQSGVGTSISFSRNNTPVRETISKIPGLLSFTVGGTPSDCVLLGLKRLKKERIDLIVSGINNGPNVGNDIFYSGTVMATLVGYFRKIPAVAISLAVKNEKERIHFNVAAQIATSIATSINTHYLGTSLIINVNVPNSPPNQIRGIRVTRTAGFGYVRLGQANDIGNSVGFNTIIGKPDKALLEEDTDVWAIREGYVSITPLRFDITDYGSIPKMMEYIPEFHWRKDKSFY